MPCMTTISRLAIALLLALGAGVAVAQEHGYREHEFREHEFHERQFLDARYHHDRYYPPHGYVFGALPSAPGSWFTVACNSTLPPGCGTAQRPSGTLLLWHRLSASWSPCYRRSIPPCGWALFPTTTPMMSTTCKARNAMPLSRRPQATS
jgi:hypothetical protein